jgi:hypothetical protein
LTESIGDVCFTNARDVELKGISGTRKVYAIAWDQ